MRITFGMTDTAERRAEFRSWWLANGILHAEPTGPIRVDYLRRTITFTRQLDQSEPGEIDFPEFRRDIENDPLSVECVVPLLVEPPAALLSQHSTSRVA